MSTWDHPLLGNDARWTFLALAGLAFTGFIILCQWAGTRYVFIGLRGYRLSLGQDVLSGFATLLVALTYFVAIGYAYYNGGPGLAVLIATAPTVFGSLLRAQFAVTIDVALALSAGTCAAWVACWRTYRGHDPPAYRAWGVGIATATTVVAAGTLRDVSLVSGAHAHQAEGVAATLFSIALLLVVLWVLEVARSTSSRQR